MATVWTPKIISRPNLDLDFNGEDAWKLAQECLERAFTKEEEDCLETVIEEAQAKKTHELAVTFTSQDSAKFTVYDEDEEKPKAEGVDLMSEKRATTQALQKLALQEDEEEDTHEAASPVPAAPRALTKSFTTSLGSGRRRFQSVKKAMTMSFQHSYSDATPLQKKLQDFQQVRVELREDHFRRVCRVVTIVIFGVFSIDCALLIGGIVDAIHPSLPLLLVTCANQLVATTCVSAICGFAVVLVDVDDSAQRLFWVRAAMAACFAIMSFMRAVDLSHVCILGIIVALSSTVRRCGSQPFTAWLISTLIICLLDAAADYVVIGLHVIDEFPEVSIHWFCLGGTCILTFGLYTAAWRLQCFNRTRMTSHNVSSISLYAAVNAYLLISGLLCIWSSTLFLAFDHSSLDLQYQYRIVAGIVSLVPSTSAIAFGKSRVSLFLASLFGFLDVSVQESDGAFLASMMDCTVIEVGRAWWVHRLAGEENTNYPKEDHRHFWRKGQICDVKHDSFVVRIKDDVYEQPLKGSNYTSQELLVMARASLRCIDWSQLTKAVLKGDLSVDPNLRSSKEIPQARRLRDDEKRIDFFVSHSWYDSADLKYAQLERIAQGFQEKRGRDPTFWLDHVCIDQENILDGLKTLPVVIFSCTQLIALCGPTYLSRLWCAWELCTRLTFDPPEVSNQNLIICPVGYETDELVAKILNFDINEARCYDPNEQARVQSVVEVIGPDHFNKRVRELGRTKTRSILQSDTSSLVTSTLSQMLKIRSK